MEIIRQRQCSLKAAMIIREIRSQQVNSNIAIQTQRDIERNDRKITEHRSHINSELINDTYLTMTGQEDYTNPFLLNNLNNPQDLLS
jgi:hypothetical protein